MLNQSAVISNVADAIINSRDFCGDEREAARESFADQGVSKPSSEQMRAAFRAADGTWAESQKAAGVKRRYWRR